MMELRHVKIIATAVVIVIVVAVAGYYAYTRFVTVPPPVELRVGAIGPMTGPAAWTGEEQAKGAKLALEELEKEGGVYVPALGRRVPVKLFIGDSKAEKDAGIAAMTKLILEDRVQVVYGGLSSAVAWVTEAIAIENRVPYIYTPSSPMIALRKDLDTSWIFQYEVHGWTYGRDVIRAIADLLYPYTKPNKVKVAVLYQDTPFGADHYKGMVLEYERNPTIRDRVEFVKVEKFPMHAKDFRAQLIAIKPTKPDALVIYGFAGETIDAMTQALKEIGVYAVMPWGTASNDIPVYYKQLGMLGDKSTIITFFGTYTYPPPIRAWALKLSGEVYKRWGTPASMWVGKFYDILRVIIPKAVEAGGDISSEKIREGLEKAEFPVMSVPMEVSPWRFGKERREPIELSDYHLVPAKSFIMQLLYDPVIGENRPRIVWPPEWAEGKFVPPEYWKP